MTVQFLRAWNGHEQFQVKDLDSTEESRLVGLGICRPWVLGTEVRSGQIASADLATAAGAIGALYELADGPNAGAKLTWAIPAGESTPTWCWWLWPQSAYTA